MVHKLTQSEEWRWECVGTHEGSGFLGAWQAHAYVAEQAGNWYASADGQKTGPEYTYRLPGRGAPSGPYTRAQAEGCARQMIGLASDASIPPADRLVLYLPTRNGGPVAGEPKDVTGARWTHATDRASRSCCICGEAITSGWAQGRWVEAPRHVCADHVEVRSEARPAEAH